MSTQPWLRNAVVDGLQGLLVLRLRGAPATDTVKAVANAWVAVLANRPIAWDEKLDRERIRQAFLQLAATCEHWPAPATFLDALPRRVPIATPLIDKPRSREIPPEARAALDKFLRKVKA